MPEAQSHNDLLRGVLGSDAEFLKLDEEAAPDVTPAPVAEVPEGETAEETVPAPDAAGGEVTFTAEQQAAIDAQLETARTEAATELQSKLEAAEQQIEALTAQADSAPLALPGGVHPLLFATEPSIIEKYHQDFLAAERWAAEHAEGFNEESPDWKPGSTPWTPAEVRRQITVLKQEHDEVYPAAKQKLEKMGAALPDIKAKFPTLFQKNHPDQIEARRLLRAYPSLLTNPRALEDIGDLLAGRRTRQAKEKAVASPATPSTPGKPASAKAAAKPAAKPPLPGGGQSAHASTRGSAPASGTLSSGKAFQDFIKTRGSGADVDKLLAGTFGRG